MQRSGNDCKRKRSRTYAQHRTNAFAKNNLFRLKIVYDKKIIRNYISDIPFWGLFEYLKEGIKEDGRPVSEMKIYRDSFRTIDVKEIDGSSAFNVEEICDSVSFIRLSSDTEATIGAIDQIIFLDSVLILRELYDSQIGKDVHLQIGKDVLQIGTVRTLYRESRKRAGRIHRTDVYGTLR